MTKSTRPHSVSKPNKVRIVFIDSKTEERYIRFRIKEDIINDVLNYLRTTMVIPLIVRGEIIGYFTNTDDGSVELFQVRTMSKFRMDILMRGVLEVKKNENGDYTAEIILKELSLSMAEKLRDQFYFKD